MNSIRISGKILQKDKIKNNNNSLKIILAMPLQMQYYDKGTFKQCYSYLSFILAGIDDDQYKYLRKGSYVEIIGCLLGNCKEDGTLKENHLTIVPNTIKKEVYKKCL